MSSVRRRAGIVTMPGRRCDRRWVRAGWPSRASGGHRPMTGRCWPRCGRCGLRDTTGDIVMATEAEQRDPTEDEIEIFRESMLQMMFLPAERSSFSTADIVKGSEVEQSQIAAVVDAFSIDFNVEVDPNTAVKDFLRGVNPLARTCLLRDSAGHHLMTGIQIGTDSFRSLAEAAVKQDAKGWRRYDRTRAEVSEALAVAALARLFQTQPTHTNLKYFGPKKGIRPDALGNDCADPREVGNQTESDGLFVIEDVAICVEVKGRTVADAARRGDLARLKREVDEILGVGAAQARRLETLIRTNGGVWLEDGSWLDLSVVREMRSVVVGLDFFGPLAVALGDLERSELLGSGSLPWITSLHDLEVISSVIDRPAEFLLYLRRRTDSGVASHYRGADELDLFMLFMEGGLYVEPDPDEIRRLHPKAPPATKRDRRQHKEDARSTIVGTYTDPLDAWMYWVEGTSPREVDKPTFNAHDSALRIVDFLAEAKKPGWLRFGADLLGLEGRAQKKLGDGIRELVNRTRVDHSWHSLTQGYAGLWGYPTFFAGSAPSGVRREEAVDNLRAYMSAKKHQVESDRSLGILVDEDRKLVHVIYMNDPPTEDAELDALGAAIGLAPVGQRSRPVPPSANRGSHRRRGHRSKKKRKR